MLLNKSLMVYTYSMYVALSSPHNGNVQFVRDQFYKTMNAFIHDEKNMASRDMIWYYDKAAKALDNFDHAVPDKWVNPGFQDLALIKVTKLNIMHPVHVVTKPHGKHLINNSNFKAPKPEPVDTNPKVERAKIKDPVVRDSPLGDIKVGNDLLFVAGLGIAGLATYIWRRWLAPDLLLP